MINFRIQKSFLKIEAFKSFHVFLCYLSKNFQYLFCKKKSSAPIPRIKTAEFVTANSITESFYFIEKSMKIFWKSFSKKVQSLEFDDRRPMRRDECLEWPPNPLFVLLRLYKTFFASSALWLQVTSVEWQKAKRVKWLLINFFPFNFN